MDKKLENTLETENMVELLKKAIIGKAVTEYFTRPVTILCSKIYSCNSQGSVLAFDGDFCWELVYKINPLTYELELIDFLSGVMSVHRDS